MEAIPNRAPQKAYILQPGGTGELALCLQLAVQNKAEDTCFAKDPALVQGVDEEDGRLRDGHEEVADGQVHDEEVGRRAQLLVAGTRRYNR